MALDARTGDVWEFENKETGKKHVHRLGAEDFPGSFLVEGGLGDHVSPMANDYRGTWRLVARATPPARARPERGGDSIRAPLSFIAKHTTYLQHVEVKPHEWRRIWAELAPQAKGKRTKKR